MIGYFVAITMALLGTASAGPFNDIVNSLPGVNMGETKMWSGFITLPDDSKKIHYMLVESQNDPSTDPLVIWYNGGPGCSSMLGFMQEHGPFLWENGKSNWTGANDYSWNQEANVLYIEQPAGVGYSHFANASDIGFQFTDLNAAQDNLQAVLGWYELFPEFKTNDLYLSGESYAGVYVPYLLYLMNNHIQANLDNPDAFLPPLKGMMVGNGVTNWKYDGSPSAFEMSYWHSMIDKELYDNKTMQNCSFNELLNEKTAECNDTRDEFDKLWSDVNIYDIFGECYISKSNLRSQKEGKVEKPYWTAADYLPWKKNIQKKGDGLNELPPCTFGTPIIEYLNSKEVMDALNIPDNIPRNNGTKQWDLCRSEEDGFFYESSLQASQWIYEALKGKYRILKYSGDVDAAVPTTGTKWWIDEMNLQVLEDWRPYFVENESMLGKTMGGYIREYKGLTLGTIHGAGHMAPQFKPRETYHLIFNWLLEKPV